DCEGARLRPAWPVAPYTALFRSGGVGALGQRVVEGRAAARVVGVADRPARARARRREAAHRAAAGGRAGVDLDEHVGVVTGGVGWAADTCGLRVRGELVVGRVLE